MRTPFNYKHLYYFWVVAKEGGITRAADKLDMAVQTVSAQVRELERSLGLRTAAALPSDRLVPQSVNEGVPVVALSPRSRVARAHGSHPASVS